MLIHEQLTHSFNCSEELFSESFQSQIDRLSALFAQSLHHETRLKIAMEQLTNLTDIYYNEKELWKFKKEVFSNIIAQHTFSHLVFKAVEEDIKNYPKLYWPLWVKAHVLITNAFFGPKRSPQTCAMEVEKALSIVNDLLSRPDIFGTPFENELVLLKSYTFNQLGKSEEVLRLLEDLLQRSNLTSTMKVDALVLKSHVLARINILKAALKCIDEALQIDPSHGLCWNIRAELLYKSNQFSEAAIANEKALNLLQQSKNQDTELSSLIAHRLQLLVSLKIPISDEKVLQSCDVLLPYCSSSLCNFVYN
jgi:tetratricopeptide (TPR) repeat protein